MKALFDLTAIKGKLGVDKRSITVDKLNGEFEVLKSHWNLKQQGLEGVVFEKGMKIKVENGRTETGYGFNKTAIKEGYIKKL